MFLRRQSYGRQKCLSCQCIFCIIEQIYSSHFFPQIGILAHLYDRFLNVQAYTVQNRDCDRLNLQICQPAQLLLAPVLTQIQLSLLRCFWEGKGVLASFEILLKGCCMVRIMISAHQKCHDIDCFSGNNKKTSGRPVQKNVTIEQFNLMHCNNSTI